MSSHLVTHSQLTEAYSGEFFGAKSVYCRYRKPVKSNVTFPYRSMVAPTTLQSTQLPRLQTVIIKQHRGYGGDNTTAHQLRTESSASPPNRKTSAPSLTCPGNEHIYSTKPESPSTIHPPSQMAEWLGPRDPNTTGIPAQYSLPEDALSTVTHCGSRDMTS